MMGTTHVGHGALMWLAVSATGLVHQSPVQVAAGTVLCASGALLPDLDLTGKDARGPGTFGRRGVALAVARVVGWAAGLVYRATATQVDLTRTRDRDEPAHRTLTHTWPWQIAVGGLAALAAGTAAGLGILTALLAVPVLRATPGVARACRGPSALLAAAAVGLAVAVTAGPSALLAGTAVGLGGLAHMVGDSATPWGVPWCWPMRRHGRRWWCSGLPRVVRIRTGRRSRPERAVRWVTFAAGVLLVAQIVGIIPALTH
jgi:hypothetical protein